MSQIAHPGRVVESLHASISSFTQLENRVDVCLSPENYHDDDANEVARIKARFAGDLESLNQQISGDGQSLLTAVDQLIQSSKSPIKEQLGERNQALKELSERTTFKIDAYPAFYEKTLTIKALISDIRNQWSWTATFPEVLQLQGRVTVCEGQLQANPRAFTEAQKDAILTMGAAVNDLYDGVLRSKLSDLHKELSPREFLFVFEEELENPEVKTARLKEALKALPLNISGAIYGKVYELSSGDRHGANWGEDHACDNLETLKKAVFEVIKKETPDLAQEILGLFEEKKSEKVDDETSEVAPLVLTAQQQALADFGRKIVDIRDGWGPELLIDTDLLNDTVRNLLEPLEESVRTKFYTLVWERAGKPQGDPDYGLNNIGRDLKELETIFQEVYLSTFPEGAQKEAIKDMFTQAAKHAAATATLDK